MRRGNRGDTFAKVGDSITSAPGFLQELTCGRWTPAAYRRSLAPTVALFSRRQLPVGSWEYCPESTSFSRVGAASLPATDSGWPLQPGEAGDIDCAQDESPLLCEFRLIKPAYAVILLGTNDVHFPWDPTAGFAANMSEMVALSQQRGVVPVLSTVPPRLAPVLEARVERLNEVLYELALSRHLPMINLWRALYSLPNRGISDDNIHPSVFGCVSSCNPNPCAPACSSVNFTPAALQFGFNSRNLATLRTLNRLRLLVRRWRQKRLRALHADVHRRTRRMTATSYAATR
jgi:hypothetical protein